MSSGGNIPDFASGLDVEPQGKRRINSQIFDLSMLKEMVLFIDMTKDWGCLLDIYMEICIIRHVRLNSK